MISNEVTGNLRRKSTAAPISTKIRLFRTRVVAAEGVIRNAYGAHRLFWRAFPDAAPGAVQPFTFAEQDGAQDGQKIFLMQSEHRPDFSLVLGVQAEVKVIHLEVNPGDFFYFRLRASPSKALHVTKDEIVPGTKSMLRGIRVGIQSRLGVQHWLDRQAGQAGFEARNLVFDINERAIKLHSVTSGKKHGFTAASAQFDGTLVVTDPEKFAQALFTGVGRGRSYGFSMLLVSK